jgi:membrane fusion protein, multidrug efflux system
VKTAWPRLWKPGAAVLACAIALPLAACSRKADSAKPVAAPPAVPVAVAPAEQKPMPVQVQAIGSAEANQVVSVKAQVGGELVKVHFKEGQDVKKGDPLFSIDRRPFQAALEQTQATLAQHQAAMRQAEANLSRDQAQLENAKVEEERYRRLVAGGFVAREQYDQFLTGLKTAQATIEADHAAVATARALIQADEATVQTARLNLAYTEIKSPIDGRTGSLMLHEGNVVRSGGTSDSTLLVINQVQPIYVSFTVPQQQLPEIKKYMQAGTLSVEAVPTGEQKAERGVVTFVDNAIDPATGTVRLKATFPNTEKRLWPGQFANVTLTLTVDPEAIVVPSQAVQTGPQGQYVFVVKPDSTAETRRVVVKRTQGSDTVIASGLKPGEPVVVDGQPRLQQGTKVNVRTPGARTPGGAPGGGGPGGVPGDAPRGAQGGAPSGAPGGGAQGGAPAGAPPGAPGGASPK